MRTKYYLISLLCLLALLPLNAQTRTVYIEKAGSIRSYFTEEEAESVTHLTLTGNINAIDFRILRDEFNNLEVLDISNAEIRMYTGKSGTHPDRMYVYPKNVIPAYAFCRQQEGETVVNETLRKIVISDKVRNIEDAAFKGCTHLQICHIRRKTPPNLFPEALADSITAVFIPAGSRDAYKAKTRWENFAFIEGEPVEVELKIGPDSNLEDEILASGNQPGNINFLKIEGKLDEKDFRLMRNYMHNLVALDLSGTDVTEIPEFTFTQKKYLLSVKLPANLQVIGQRAFSGCYRLSGTLLLPETLTTIEYGAFTGCDNLKKVIITGNTLTVIGDSIFGGQEHRLIYNK